MGGQVLLLCIRSDLQCLSFGLCQSKYWRMVKAIFSAAGQLHTSVTQTVHSWPFVWSVELKYDTWAAHLVYISPLFTFSRKSFWHFWMFGGSSFSENMPFLHPFFMCLFFSVLLCLSERRHLRGARFQQSRSSLRFSLWMRSGKGGSRLKPLFPLAAKHNTSSLFPAAAVLYKNDFRSFWFWYDEPLKFTQCELLASFASVICSI